jgi:drug/metabolite transporter (DMT)-like permease
LLPPVASALTIKKRKNLQVHRKRVKACQADNRHTEVFRSLRERKHERTVIRAGGGYLGNHLDCDFSATRACRGSRVHFWRFAVACAIMMIVLVALRRLRKLSLRDHLFCIIQGCCVFCFNFWCFYTAAAHINTGLESVIFSMAVLYNAINSFIFFGQRPPARFWTAAALGLIGIITLFWDDLLASGWSASLLTGIGLSALGTYGFSLGNMISMRHQRNGLETMTTNAWAMLYGTLVMGCIALIRETALHPSGR